MLISCISSILYDKWSCRVSDHDCMASDHVRHNLTWGEWAMVISRSCQHLLHHNTYVKDIHPLTYLCDIAVLLYEAGLDPDTWYTSVYLSPALWIRYCIVQYGGDDMCSLQQPPPIPPHNIKCMGRCFTFLHLRCWGLHILEWTLERIHDSHWHHGGSEVTT